LFVVRKSRKENTSRSKIDTSLEGLKRCYDLVTRGAVPKTPGDARVGVSGQAYLISL
jgi:hypothetical protein